MCDCMPPTIQRATAGWVVGWLAGLGHCRSPIWWRAAEGQRMHGWRNIVEGTCWLAGWLAWVTAGH